MSSQPTKEILQSILVYSINHNGGIFPSAEKFIYDELIRGTVEYLTKVKCNISVPLQSDDFEYNMFDYFRAELADRKRILYPGISDILLGLLKPYSDSNGKCDIMLYSILPEIRKKTKKSYFSIDKETISNIKREFVPKQPFKAIDNLMGIGICMRRYIKRDLEYITAKQADN